MRSRINNNESLEKIILSEVANKKNQIQYVMGVFNISIICALVIIQYGTDIGIQNLGNIINDWDNNSKQILKDYLDMKGIEWDVKI
ncbi:hypothetical protein J3U68_09820 [Snodgrassella sp. B3882]|uniref:hypothetical protein n=2 Tax=Pseudomonadati TaxID=3379134 RepID=UPI00226A701E|nr:hypothetical protein [Snodgrassella sp. B3882]MCX8745704.1 hypothetical protein [Snodgrassella sp. B3882]